MSDPAPVTGTRVAQATPPPQDPPAEDLPWGEAPPPAGTPAPTGETGTPEPGAEDQPWGGQPQASSFVRKPWLPELRLGLAGGAAFMDNGDITGGGRFDMYWANPDMIWHLNLGPVPAPVHFYPRIETTVTPEYQTLTGGLSIHLLDPNLFSIYGNIMGGVTFTNQDVDDGMGGTNSELQINGNFSTGVGAQVRIPIRSPLLSAFIEYNRGWLDPAQTNEVFLGMRLQL